MTIDEALEEADFISEGCGVSEQTARATMTLAAEVRRLRAGVEAVRALQGYYELGEYLDRSDVLAALDDPVEPEVGGDG